MNALLPAEFLSEAKLAATVFVVVLAIERLLPAERRQPWRPVVFNVAVAAIFLYLTTLLVPYASRVTEPVRAAVHGLIPIHLGGGITGSFLQTVAFFVVFDFFFYWWHRGQHRYRWLWEQHRFHHQDRHVNVTTVHRYHFTEEIFRVFVIFLPMSVLFDFSTPEIATFWMAFLLWGYWIHSNLRINLGPLGRWISGPHFHRYHHNPERLNYNFAAFFPFWDRLFGTYMHPQAGDYPVTGVRHADDGNTFYDALLRPFVMWGRLIARAWRTHRPGAVTP